MFNLPEHVALLIMPLPGKKDDAGLPIPHKSGIAAERDYLHVPVTRHPNAVSRDLGKPAHEYLSGKTECPNFPSKSASRK